MVGSIGWFRIFTWKIVVSPNIHLKLVAWSSKQKKAKMATFQRNLNLLSYFPNHHSWSACWVSSVAGTTPSPNLRFEHVKHGPPVAHFIHKILHDTPKTATVKNDIMECLTPLGLPVTLHAPALVCLVKPLATGRLNHVPRSPPSLHVLLELLPAAILMLGERTEHGRTCQRKTKRFHHILYQHVSLIRW